MHVEIHRLDPTLPLPKYETPGSFAFDFVAREDYEVPSQSFGLIPGNVIIQCPPDHALLILPRSSTPKRKSLIFPHSIGLIDHDYSGPSDEIMIQVYNIAHQPVKIERGERIAQGLFVKMGRASFSEVEKVERESRGGFGSTGSNISEQ